MSGTTGSKSSYSTSGSIADYKKQGYELVTDGYPADLTFRRTRWTKVAN
ncbi:mucin-binding protein [Streptococcus infantarius]|nr:hypothetical protein [Streptococcus infantarius]